MFSLLGKYNVEGLHFLQNFHHFRHYSTSSKAVTPSFAEYLVNHLGFSRQQALSTSIKLQSQKVNDFNSCDNANSVVLFFKQHGFDDTHVRKIVSLYPKILCCNVDRTLKPKFKLLQEEGFSGSDLIRVMLINPEFVARRLMNGIISNLRTILGSDEKLMKFLKQNMSYITSAGLKNVVSNVELLTKDYGFDIDVIREHLVRFTGPFLRKPEYFQNLVTRVEEELGIPRDSRMFMYGINLLSSYGKNIIESKCQLFKSFGWTDSQIFELIRRNPCSFTSSKENLRKKLGFLVNELGYQPGFLASRPPLFTCSLEKRMVPRHRVLLILKEKGLLDYNFFNATLKTEADFLILVKPFQDDVPRLLEIYNNSQGYPNTDPLS